MDVSVENEIVLDVEVSEKIEVGGEFPYYDGAYRVTPKPTEQTLATRNTTLQDNVKIDAIPLQEVSNPYGGKTIVIS